MFILHVTNHSLVRYTPARISCYWGRYTEHRGAAVCLNRPGGPGQFKEPLNPYGVLYCRGHLDALANMARRADVIHCHDDAYPTKVPGWVGKKLVYHAHIGDIPRRLFKSRRFKYHPEVRHACITNGYGRHFDQEERRSKVPWGRLPDILDLDHPVYAPATLDDRRGPFRVVFTYSNPHEPGRKINAKGPVATKQTLGRIPGVEIQIVTKLKFEESMAIKRRAHIVLDEIFSPYTHLSALEGAAAGACVLTSHDEYTRKELCETVGAPIESYPFVEVTRQNVVRKINHFRDHPKEAAEIGRAARDWMEKYYHHKKLLQLYMDFYHAR